MIKNKEKKFAKRLISLLNKRGFIVKAHKSKTSKSIYLKIIFYTWNYTFPY